MNHLLTTGFGFEGYKITDYFGIYSAERVFVSSFRKEGEKWDAAHQEVLDKLVAKLPEQANAVIGIHFEHTVFCGNDRIIATGTAVSVEKL